MKNPNSGPEPVRYVRARRISTGDGHETGAIDEEVGVVEETPVSIDVEGVETYTVMCTPSDRRALALGFLFTEGVVESLSDVKSLEPCKDDSNVVRVRLTGKVPRIADPGRNLLIVSSCGVCGSEDLASRIGALPAVANTLSVRGQLLRSAHDVLRSKQRLFKSCGGTHAAGIFDSNGELLTWAEDAGRHNALDKAIGKCLLGSVTTSGRGVVLSGRVSLEMVSKCARAGIELISAISAPTSLAIEVAEKCDITLCAFVRETRATVFSHPQRIIE